jgi:nitrogenase subunit NifH
MHTLTFFNHKGGVGKTTLTINVADMLVDLGLRVLMIDADPQCNLTSFYLSEDKLDTLLGESDDVNGGTLWSAIKPVVDGKGRSSKSTLTRFGRASICAPATYCLRIMRRNFLLPGRDRSLERNVTMT